MNRFRAWVLDDEPLAVRRLLRLLEATSRFEIVGAATDPRAAAASLAQHQIDVLFLDIRMPGMNGFEFLAHLDVQPMVVFTTAFDEYALHAFDVNSIDYLLKPVQPEQLQRVIRKLDSFGAAPRTADLRALFERLAQPEYLDRIAVHSGNRLQVLPLSEITHFQARDKLTWASSAGRSWLVDHTLADLEKKLDPRRFVRIHRATLLNLEWAEEVHRWFARGVMVRLRDEKHTELPVSRDRVSALKERLGL